MFSGVFMFPAKAASFPNLPTSPVNIEVTSAVNTYPLTIVLSNVPSGYDVSNGPYTGFCADLLTTISNNVVYSGTLTSSLGLGEEWSEINYILNNVPAGATGQDIQAAIWLVQEPFTDAEILAHAGFTPTALANTMAANAEAANPESGIGDFVPSPGQIVSVMISVAGEQSLLIELREPSQAPPQPNIYVPPGPAGSASEWISPTLATFVGSPGHLSGPIGTFYTDGPYWNTYTRTGSTTAVTQTNPWAFTPTGFSSSSLSAATTTVPYGDQVTVVGFIPGVNVAPGDVPPPVELQVTWNGIPGVITLTDPTNYTVSNTYPPTIYKDVATSYTWCYPTTGANKAASYQLWDGNYAPVLSYLWGTTGAPAWWSSVYGPAAAAQNGEWFWYTFTPNAGDWIALDSSGQVSTPPTYDVTAMFEYATTQIWFNHVDFNVLLLELHKDVSWCPANQAINDQISIVDVGAGPLATVNSLVLTQTFPGLIKLNIAPEWANIQIFNTATDAIVGPSVPLPNFYNLEYPSTYAINSSGLPSTYTSLTAGETMVITMQLSVSDTSGSAPTTSGAIVFEAIAMANQIAPWKSPIAYGVLRYPAVSDGAVGTSDSSDPVTLWTGYTLEVVSGVITFHSCAEIGGVSSVISGHIIQTVVAPLPSAAWTLDPAPVPLIAGETSVTAADVALGKKRDAQD